MITRLPVRVRMIAGLFLGTLWTFGAVIALLQHQIAGVIVFIPGATALVFGFTALGQYRREQANPKGPPAP